MTLLNWLRLTRKSSSLNCIGGKPRHYISRSLNRIFFCYHTFPCSDLCDSCFSKNILGLLVCLRNPAGVVSIGADADGCLVQCTGLREPLYKAVIVQHIISVDLQSDIAARGLCC